MTTTRGWLREVGVPLAASKVVVLVVGAVTIVLLFPALSPLAVPTQLVQWDAHSYLAIAQHGYPATPGYLDAFLPGFPILIRAMSVLTRNYVDAALVVCLVAEGLALWWFWRLVRAERDAPSAGFCVLLLAFFPTAVFLSAPFTEAPFIAAAAASLMFARQGRMLPASVAAACAVAMRLTGLALLPALAVEVATRHGVRHRQAWATLLLVPVPLVLYCAYMAVTTGDALALFHAEASPSFGQSLSAPWNGFSATWQTMVTATDGETRSIFAREVAFGLLGLAACVAMWVSRRIPRSFAVYCSLAWLMTASLSFWRSEPRYILALFPALIVLSDVTARIRAARPALLGVSAVLMCLGTSVFVQGRWLG
jgi:hypothetical protein